MSATTNTIEVQAHWDPEAGVWWAESTDLPGLVSEAPTLEALIERVTQVIPDLIAAAAGTQAAAPSPKRLTFRADRTVEVAA